MSPKLAALSFVLTVVAAVFNLVHPVYSGSHGNEFFRATLIEVNGTWAVAPVTFPVFVAAVALVYRKQVVRIIAAILIGGFSLIAMSIGLLYLPAAVVMVLAACVADGANMPDAAR